MKSDTDVKELIAAAMPPVAPGTGVTPSEGHTPPAPAAPAPEASPNVESGDADPEPTEDSEEKETELQLLGQVPGASRLPPWFAWAERLLVTGPDKEGLVHVVTSHSSVPRGVTGPPAFVGAAFMPTLLEYINLDSIPGVTDVTTTDDEVAADAASDIAVTEPPQEEN